MLKASEVSVTAHQEFTWVAKALKHPESPSSTELYGLTQCRIRNGEPNAKQLLMSFYNHSQTAMSRQSPTRGIQHRYFVYTGVELFLTSTGYVGVGPLDTRVGDEVCVFIGGNAAYLVRLEENKLHSLIGEAYVHGVMYGELLKGDFEQRKLYTLR